MTLHREINFETEICEYLATHGWLYADGDAQRYDRARALFPADLIAWVNATRPKDCDALLRNGEAALLDRVRKQLDSRGTLDVIRHGIDVIGARTTLKLAEFKPALAENPEIVARYRANRLRVVRQVRYSTANGNAIDLVLFLNGLPVATVELKTDSTQSVRDAVDQYRFDRHPKPPGQSAEPLLSFPGGALIHFAVSNQEVQMTTRLEGKDTFFLPFNLGDNGGAGNPVDPARGHRTGYLWETVWEREGWLELLGRYIIPEKDKKKQLTRYIFPRFHQLDATRKLVKAVLEEGPGQKYLIQHSAGSGKTNSIAWSAHFLADLHDAEKRKIFDTVIVVSDRRVIDGQLQNAIFAFERTTGVVATIKGEGGSKSAELAEALAGGKKIVVCTIQTFPPALKEVRRLAVAEGKSFAVIADEAHSSQTGEAAAKLKEMLSAEELEELKDGGEISTEDILAAQMRSRARDDGVTYVAFTATPKPKTMELFGRRPRPDQPAGPDNLPEPFHVYSMRQAIEEGFILDVLQNYTPYSLALKLSKQGREIAANEVERDAAMRGLMTWVKLHPYNIAQKVAVVVEHFRAKVAGLLGGKAKAMVVLGSRVEAVRWKLAIDGYIREQGYGIGTMVAFSGEVKDRESGTDPFTEKSAEMNPDLKGRDIKEAFATDDFHILLVANKFQTGFDQPLLCAMYVDRRLAGVQAVQTLSRLNRAYKKDGVLKDTTYVLDFSESSEEVLKAFGQYYGKAELENVTDPNIIFDLRAKLDGAGHYDDFEIDHVVRVELDARFKQSDLKRAIDPVAKRTVDQFKAAEAEHRAAQDRDDDAAARAAKDVMDALDMFKKDMEAFVRI
ncbi:MAG: type I restriction endonuclease subunit R [Paracoccaceae bacterium]